MAARFPNDANIILALAAIYGIGLAVYYAGRWWWG